MRFSLTLKSSKGEFCIGIDPSGNALDVRNLYPTLTLNIADEVRDDKRRWKPERAMSVSNFTALRFVREAKRFLRQFTENKDLFKYVDGVLSVDTDLANKLAVTTVVDFETRVALLAVVGKDPDTGLRYEGIALCIRNISNHTVFTYDELVSLVQYIEKFDFDVMGLKLLNIALSSVGANNIASGSVVSAPRNTDSNYSAGAPGNAAIPELP